MKGNKGRWWGFEGHDLRLPATQRHQTQRNRAGNESDNDSTYLSASIFCLTVGWTWNRDGGAQERRCLPERDAVAEKELVSKSLPPLLTTQVLKD